jgi:Rrf2 family transcriptional regulator, cysteine metabolism repressor
MKLSTKGRYGTRALVDLARHYGEGPVLLKDIARRQQISLQYLEHIIGTLIAAGLVKSSRGVKGGVWLARSPGETRLSEAIGYLEGDITPVECISNPGACKRSGACATRDIWSEMKHAIDGVLQSVTLQDLVERQEKKEQPAGEMYDI